MTDAQVDAPRLRVLVVEGESLKAEAVRPCLNRASYVVVGAVQTAEQAIATAEQARPAVMLVDMDIKGPMDAVEAADHLYQRLDIPTVYVTSRSDAAARERSRGPARFGYVLAPFQEGELLIALEIAIHRHRAEQSLRTRENAPDSKARTRTEEALRESESILQRSQQQRQRQFDRLEAQRAIDASIIHNRDLLSTLRLVLVKTLALLGADAVAILLPNRETESLEYAAFQGFPGGIIPPPDVEHRNEPAEKAAQERRRISLWDLPDGGREFRRNLSEYGEAFSHYYAVPLIADGVVHGVLEVYTREAPPSDCEWMESLESLAAQAAIAAHHATLLSDLERANEEMLVSNDATIAGWSRALDLRDKETVGHSERVTNLTLRLARSMGIEGDSLLQLRRGALLHDVGKLGIPDSILLKNGPLTEEEWAIMQQHPTYAYELLNPIAFLRPALAIPYCHHEKWDGTGYPNGLAGEQIPLAARIFALADVYDALCSDRPYRAGWPPSRVREHIRGLSGTHLDPAVVEAFLRLEEEF